MSESEDLDSNDDMNDLGYLQNQAALLGNEPKQAPSMPLHKNIWNVLYSSLAGK